MTLLNRLTFFNLLCNFHIFRPNLKQNKKRWLFLNFCFATLFFGASIYFIFAFFSSFFGPVHDLKYFLKGSVFFFCILQLKMWMKKKENVQRNGETSPACTRSLRSKKTKKNERKPYFLSFQGKCRLKVHSKPAKHTVFFSL